MSKIDIKILRVFRFDGEGACKASFSWSLNDAITFSGWRILDGSKGLWITSPQQKSKEKYFPLITINNKSILKALTDAALEEFGKEEPKKSSKKPAKEEDFEDDLPF